MSARAAASLHVAIPSKGRAGRVRTLAVLPAAHVYVPALEAAAYKATGAANVVSVPDAVRGITATRNWILDHTKSRRVVMIDDDVRTQGWSQLLDTSVHKQHLDQGTWLAEFRKLFEVTEQLDFRIWGVATESATRSCYPWAPFRFRAYVTASCMGIINDGRTRFDEAFPVKEDYELCARCITQDGGVVAAQYLFWENSHWHDAGGCKDYRTQALERDCIRRLCKAYPGLVRAVERAGSEWNVEVG
jgi:TET-associated glycosyltransferase-like protein